MTAKEIEQKRGRPRAFDVDAALETALALFHERGYDGVGVAELSQAMGIKPPSLYAAFGSKQGLFERAVDLYLARSGGFVRAALDEPGPAADVIARLFNRAAEAYTSEGGPLGCLIMDGARNSAEPAACAFTAGLQEASRKAVIERILRDLPAEGAAAAAGRLADFVMVTLAGLSAAARDGMPREALREAGAIAAAGFAAAVAQAGA
ncbi:TetR/AcrR family transcriptional regulator [Pelagibius sp.]|uniref:TetR/AcrR family transcriptional regulator n=1 Tax=Pelagibius sp. TaxID=1931238 RepID=UPI00262CA09D|nr:TetR/AcrR family transcriptional regulator [Pelagibius sp.]